MQWGMKKRDFQLIYRFISEMIQEKAMVTMEETALKLLNNAISNDLE